MAYQFGDVLLVPFPFTDQSASKQRKWQHHDKERGNR